MSSSIPALVALSPSFRTRGDPSPGTSPPTTDTGLRPLPEHTAAGDGPMSRKHPATPLTLVSHHLCPYVQRAAIALAEKDVPFERCWVDLADKPPWFDAVSPLGKVPLLLVEPEGGAPSAIFESAVILEYLEETQPNPLHPADPLARARERAWMELGSAVLDAIAALYNAPDAVSLDARGERIRALFERLEDELAAREPRWSGPYFRGTAFGLVDAVFGPVFRYFDAFESVADLYLLADREHVARWRDALAERPSVRDAIDADHAARLERFLRARSSAIGERVRDRDGGSAPCVRSG